MNMIDTSLFNFVCEYRKSKDNLAVSQGCRAVSFVRFQKLVKDLASRFASAGIKKGDVIAISLPNIIQNVIAVYAASLIGAVVYELHPKIGTGTGTIRSDRYPRKMWIRPQVEVRWQHPVA